MNKSHLIFKPCASGSLRALNLPTAPRAGRLFGALAIFVLMFVFAAASAPAQSNPALSGRVADRQGAAVTGASVTIFERDNRQHQTAVTNDAGAFRFLALAPGEYVIEVEADGFARLNRVINVAANATPMLDLTLDVAGVAEQVVVVTASGTAQSVDEVSKAVSVVGAGEIELRNEFSIVESLRTVPGLRVQQTGGPGALTSIKTRGLRNEDTAVLIDGLRFRDSATTQGDATSFLSDLLFVNTDRLEVLRGSGSSLYGSNAIGGVINILTDEGGGEPRGEVQLEGGNLGFFRGRAKIAGGAFRDRLQYSAGLAHLNVSRGVDDNDATRNTSGQGFARFDFTPNISLTGRIFAGDTFVQLNDSPLAISNNTQGFVLPPAGTPVRAVALARDEQRRIETVGLPFGGTTQFTRGDATFIPNFDDPDNRRDSRFFAGAMTFAQRLSDDVSYRVSYQRVATARLFSDGPAGVRFELPYNSFTDIDGRIDTLNARTDLRLGRYNLVTAGYEFERETYGSTSRDENPTAPANNFTGISQRSHTVFAQDQMRFLEDRLQLAAAIRVQAFRLSQPEFRGALSPYAGVTIETPSTAVTGDGSISYLFRSTGTKLRAHVGNGYRAPSAYERFGGFFGLTVTPYGDPRLRPDRSVAFDAGIDQTFGRNRVRTSATYFYTRLQEVVAFDFGAFAGVTDPFGRTGGYINTGGALARGVELSAALAPTRTLDITASYTYTNSDQRRPQVPGYLKTLGISDHLFTVVANQRVGRRVDLTFDLFAASDYAINFSSRPFIFDGPVKAALGASYTLPLGDDRRALRFYAKVDNIFDREYFENGFRTPGAQFIGGTMFRF